LTKIKKKFKKEKMKNYPKFNSREYRKFGANLEKYRKPDLTEISEKISTEVDGKMEMTGEEFAGILIAILIVTIGNFSIMAIAKIISDLQFYFKN